MKILLLTDEKFEKYCNAVASFGHEPVLEAENLDEVDGVILCGGADVHPKYYGQQINGARQIDDKRDEREVPIARECIARRIPLLGICRGHQLLNALLGGTLIQDLPNAENHTRAVPGQESTHTVQAKVGSLFYELYGESFVVNTSHHQAIDRLADGFVAELLAPDGTIEGCIHESLPIFSVQWHPERMMPPLRTEEMADGGLIFRHFFKMIEKTQSSRR